MTDLPSSLSEHEILAQNAGLVLLNNYFQLLFKRLNCIENQVFTSKQDQQNAIHYLQYLATGFTQTDDSYLALNKVLCGFPLSEAISNTVTISDSDKNLMDGLITAAIDHWSGIGQTSNEGFRGNWLVRDGLLIEHDSLWELTVEKKAYDILLIKSPYSFSIIKFPWMPKPLHVYWPY
ncbi:contractile injection system tape measure protein [Psychroserpens algicola]|uniref:contractile injection system tape measure protein n=1 Tax=Psychroserpens algicola TaxID=1719034 RepID=UPI001953008D|nr:contractile injection system tape measure protein [Psychroserpens algicola]